MRFRSLAGLGNLMRKDTLEWLATPRAIATTLGTTTFTTMATLGPWIGRSRGLHAAGLSFDATSSLVAGGWLTLVPVIGALATLAIVVVERETATLAWSLSKPTTRSAFLASKLLTGTGMFAVFGIALPMLVASAAATLAYGSPPSFGTVGWLYVATLAPTFFLVVLNVAVSVCAWSQAAVAVAALGVVLGSQAIQSLVPETHDLLPTTIGEWAMRLGAGGAGTLVTPLAYCVAIAGLIVLARNRLDVVDV